MPQSRGLIENSSGCSGRAPSFAIMRSPVRSRLTPPNSQPLAFSSFPTAPVLVP